MKASKSILFSIVLLAFRTILTAAIPPSERAALIALYNSTNGDSWGWKNGWKTPPLDTDGFAMPGTENTWWGIKTDGENSTVVKIELDLNNLTGVLPSSLGDLTNLKQIYIYDNPQLSGPIPASLGNLKNLQNLFLMDNQLTGAIPAELGNCSQLTVLSVSGNQLTGPIPAQLGNLSNLYSLGLSANQLTGPIPAALGNLSNLTGLSFWRNQLTGSIPPELGNLSKLKSLDLGNNQLTGSIPPQLGNLSSLENLWLNSNQLTGSLPSQLGLLSHLTYLYLFKNQLSGSIPPQLGNLSNLKNLDLSHNQFTGSIPAELGQLSNLISLELWSNHLSGAIPPELGNLSNLDILYLSRNQLKGAIPHSFINLTQLGVPAWENNYEVFLHLEYNGLFSDDAGLTAFLNSKSTDWAETQTIAPSGVTAAPTGAGSILVSWTPIPYDGDSGGYRIFYGTTSGGPYTLCAQTADKKAMSSVVSGLTVGQPYYFVIQTWTEAHPDNQNVLESDYSEEAVSTPGDLPLALISPNGGEIWKCGSVHSLTWGSTVTIANVKLEYSANNGTDWTTIVASTANANSYAWTVPELSSTSCLVRVSEASSGTPSDASDSVFTISPLMPPAAERQALIDLYNSTGGDSWWYRSGWKTAPLDADGFAMRGTENTWYGVTTDAANMTVLKIDLAANNLTGFLPPSLSSLPNLTELRLLYNRITGTIPPQIGNLSHLQHLSLCANKFTSLPAELGNLKSLRQLDVTANQITGSIPAELGNLTSLEELYLDGNQLTGSIPAEIGNLSHLEELHLEFNQLTGSIPVELGNLANLGAVYLYNNQLTGSIPATLGNLSRLWELFLYNNQLTGPIPAQLGNLNHLLRLRLFSNQLTGSIPSELGNLVELRELWISGNQLSGPIPTALGNLSNLYDLSLSANQLTGSIPAALGNLSKLSSLKLSKNRLTGTIPAALGNLTNLRNLYLSGNQLEGPIPENLTNLVGLIPSGGMHSNSSGIGYNMLFSNNAGLTSFLNTVDPDWAVTQTLAPTDIKAVPIGTGSVLVSWTPIVYTADSGGYEVFYSTASGGPYSLFGQTPSKTDSTLQVTGLSLFVPYYFVVKTKTLAHQDNPNIVESGASAEASATPLEGVPWIQLSQTTFDFGAVQYGATNAPGQCTVSNAGTGVMNWTAAGSNDWLTVTPGSGTDSGVLTIAIARTDLSPGTYQGTVTVTALGATNNPQTITVNYQVYDAAANPPFGYFEKPEGGTVASAIAVTGWALDNTGVASVKIYYGTGLADRAYIGDAVFVKGARPDVEAAYPGYPQNDRAGWGYMLLTNFLPLGDGPYNLLAYATDLDGNEVLLGQKSIVVDNAGAVKPFGAIDTPAQGGTASGSLFYNFGWVLTPQPNSIPLDGSTLSVWIDGALVGKPTYGNYRADIATLFAGYQNADKAVGVFNLNTTAFPNGVHTIEWSAVDSAGHADGIGSRYFSIQNGPGAPVPGSESDRMIRSIEEISGLPEDIQTPVFAKKGIAPGAAAGMVAPEADGTVRIAIPELTRVAVYLNESDAVESEVESRIRGKRMLDRYAPAGRYEAYQLVLDELRPMPIGASFDPDDGVLYWQPGPGFFGEFRFVIIDNQSRMKKTIKVVITG